MNLETMTIEQLKALAYDTMLNIQQQQYNMQMITNTISKKQDELNKEKVANVFKKQKDIVKSKESIALPKLEDEQKLTEVESKINESDQ